MIKIDIPSEDKKYIEKMHWQWFSDYYKDKLQLKKNMKKYSFLRYKKNGKEEEIVTEVEIVKLLDYLTNQEILKTLVIGKLVEDDNGKLTAFSITKDILKRFPLVFNIPINKNIKSLLKAKRIEIEIVRDRNQDLNEVEKIKTELFNYFENNKEILIYYIKNFGDIKQRIEDIKIKNGKIYNFNIDKFIEFKFDKEEIFLEVRKIFSEIFNYDKFTNINNESWNAYKLLEKLNVNTCPYCNRSYTNTFYDYSGMCRADIDHFFPKSKYPFLGVSLYNLIPSCHTCNSSFKGDTDTFFIKHIYPYENDFGESAKFKTNMREDNPLDYILADSMNFDIILDIKDEIKKNEIQNSNNMFKIESLYNCHKEIVHEMIKKMYIYNSEKIDELLNQYPQLFKTKKEILGILFSSYFEAEDYSKRPLLKFEKDIFEEFDFHKIIKPD